MICKKSLDISESTILNSSEKDKRIIEALKAIEGLKRSLEGHKMNLEGIKRTLLGVLRA
jgi:hypothetical protein